MIETGLSNTKNIQDFLFNLRFFIPLEVFLPVPLLNMNRGHFLKRKIDFFLLTGSGKILFSF